MQKTFQITLQNRKSLYQILKATPPELLLKIPEGYANNIWWNIVHVVVTQQLLVYDLSNLEMLIHEDLIRRFRGGTVPDAVTSVNEIEEVAPYLFSTVEQTEQDYEKGQFKEFKEYTTANKVKLMTVEDALQFNLFHEGLHLGVILSLRKALM